MSEVRKGTTRNTKMKIKDAKYLIRF
jgi:hypothetical protein